MNSSKLKDKGFKKAARFLMLLGKDEAARVLKHLSEEEVTGISRQIAILEKMSTGEASRILEDFGYLLKTRDLVARGGIVKAKEILKEAFGEEKAGVIIEKILERTAPHPFAFLMDLDIEQVKLLLKNESAPVIAVILPHLSPERAGQILSALPAEMRQNVVRRIARLEKIDPEVLRRAEGTLKEKIRAQGQIVTREIDGKSVLVEILKNMDSASEELILDKLKIYDQNLALEIEKKLFTMDILLKLRDRDLQAVLRDYSDTELALIVKGLDDTLKERIVQNMSPRRWEIIREEAQAQGAVFRSEIDKAIQEFLDYIRLQKEKGEISIVEDQDRIVP